MKLKKILDWTDRLLECGKFDDVSNNGLQIDREGDDIRKVAFAVDGSAKSIKAAAKEGAQLLIVHHGISWGGGIKRITRGEYNVVKAAMDANIALAGFHLPLDANKKVGNNWELARYFGLKDIRPAFNYHGNIIGVVGELKGKRAEGLEGLLTALTPLRPNALTPLRPNALTPLRPNALTPLRPNALIGVCSGGAGSFAADAKELGCDLYVTGEADWGEVIAAENVGMKMVCAGHYETETFGVKALMKSMKKALKISTVFVSLMFCLALNAETYVGAAGSLVLPQGGSKMSHLGGAVFNGGYYLNEWFALEAETAWMEDRAGLAARALVHFKGWSEWDMLFGYSRFDPFFTVGAKGWLPDGQVGPAFGVGLLYYLDDNWALRFGGEATLGLDSRTEMIYSLALGVQYSW